MSLYDPDNEQHMTYLRRWRAAWTPEVEAKYRAELDRLGIKDDPEWTRSIEEAKARARAVWEAAQCGS